jgi:RNA polymerase sigma-70 factor (ECF subfamily)
MDGMAFREILRSQGDRIYGYAFHFLRNRQDAEDVTQEAFTRLWRQCGVGDDRGRTAWLLRVTRNLCIDLARRRQAHGRRLSALAWEQEGSSPAAAASADDPLATAARSEMKADLAAALAQLPSEMSELLLLHYREGLTYREIGSIVGAKSATVKVRVFRAREKLRDLIESGLAAARESREGTG